MNKLEQINKILSKQRNGTFVSVKYTSNQDKKMSASYRNGGGTVIKEGMITAIKGSSYNNRKSVREKIKQQQENGETPAKRESYFEPIPGYDGRTFCQSKKDPNKQYLVLYPCGTRKKVNYYYNGEKKDKAWLQEHGVMQPSFWNHSGSPDNSHIVISLDNIDEINGKKVH